MEPDTRQRKESRRRLLQRTHTGWRKRTERSTKNFLSNKEISVNPFYTDNWCNDKIRYDDNLNVTKPSLTRWQLHTRESVNLYSDGVLLRNKLTYSGGPIDVCNQHPRLLVSCIKCVYLLILCFTENRRMSYAVIKVQDCYYTCFNGKLRRFLEISFLATENHALNNKHRGKRCNCCAFHDILVTWNKSV